MEMWTEIIKLLRWQTKLLPDLISLQGWPIFMVIFMLMSKDKKNPTSVLGPSSLPKFFTKDPLYRIYNNRFFTKDPLYRIYNNRFFTKDPLYRIYNNRFFTKDPLYRIYNNRFFTKDPLYRIYNNRFFTKDPLYRIYNNRFFTKDPLYRIYNNRLFISADRSLQESMQTLKMAQGTRSIRNKVTVNLVSIYYFIHHKT